MSDRPLQAGHMTALFVNFAQPIVLVSGTIALSRPA
jgi:hypothetical protein